MAKRDVTLPSGLRLELRGLKVDDFWILSSDTLARKNRTIVELLSAVTVRVIEWGPYEESKFSWDTALLGDQMTAMIEARIATHGDSFDFDTKCPACREKIRWSIDLTQLERQPYSPEALAAFKSELSGGQPMTIKMGGRMLSLRSVTVEVATDAAKAAADTHEAIIEARKAERQKRKGGKGRGRNTAAPDADVMGEKMNMLLEGLATRVVAVEGIESDGIRDWLKEMDLGELVALRKISDENDGGIETATLVVCQNEECGVTSEIELPLDRKQFWLAAI